MHEHPASDPQRSAQLQAGLSELARKGPDVLEAVISTEDGFEVAAVGASQLSPAKVAAMTSSLHAVGAAMSGESGLGNCRNVIVEAAAGTIVVMRIEAPGAALLLTVVGRRNALLGTLLFASRQFAVDTARSLKP